MSTSHYLPRELPKELAPLVPLALDLRWSWSHDADDLWRSIDARLWDASENPWLILETVSARRLEAMARDEGFLGRLRAVVDERDAYLRRPTWRESSGLGVGRVAFFSMEYALSEALPIYSGGLGVLAGDYLKTASDLGVPVIGVGLLYQQGYFRQVIDARGEQVEINPYNSPTLLPVMPLRDADGEWARVELELPGRTLYLRAWEAQVGRVKLYLLDSNDPLNLPRDRGITGELYAPGQELRLQQEIVLGLGGWLLLDQLGDEVDVCHLNEGHAAFAVLARARAYQRAMGGDFERALWTTRAGNLFTTHTPVAAGFDSFEPWLVERYLAPLAGALGVPARALLGLGRIDARDERAPFNMAYLAVRGSARVNGVSALHGLVSRHIFEPLFPRLPTAEVPVSHVTNGVHVPSWESVPAGEVWSQACGAERWIALPEDVGAKLAATSDETLWNMRVRARADLVAYVRQRHHLQCAARGEPEAAVDSAGQVLGPDVLTIGFARRFATYKRPTLLLSDPARLLRLLLDARRPVQLIIAGKAHPADNPGRALVQEWSRFIERPEVRGRVVFIEDYDLQVAESLVHGVDLWLNTPRRPWEASGTSGMKVLVNGGLNLSQLDGWWPEAYSPAVGWALGDGHEHDQGNDGADADQLYRLLEEEIVPSFYERNAAGIPAAWVERLRQSMATLTPRFSTDRMLVEYAKAHYEPLTAAFRARVGAEGKLGAALADWWRATSARWPKLRFGTVTSRAEGEQLRFEAQVYLGELSPDSVRVELYAEARGTGEPLRKIMTARGPLAPGLGGEGGQLFEAVVPADRPPGDYTARALPFHASAMLPIEAPLVTWAH
jgi:starch phosphorylase